MARQKGIIKLEGTVGDINFYRSGDGYMAREKGGVSGDRIASDPAFKRTRENGQEFGRAGKAGKLLRTSMQTLLRTASDRRMVSRLTKEMVKVIQADAVSVRGERNVIDGEAELLTGFEFNIQGKLSTTFFAPYESTMDRVTGETMIDIPSFIPMNSINIPGGCTHFKIMSGAMEVDFTNGTYISGTQESPILPYDGVATTALQLQVALSAGSTHPLFQVLGIVFYQFVNNEYYILSNGTYNALQLCKVLGA